MVDCLEKKDKNVKEIKKLGIDGPKMAKKLKNGHAQIVELRSKN